MIQFLKYTTQHSLHTIRVRKDISNRTQKAVTIKKQTYKLKSKF